MRNGSLSEVLELNGNQNNRELLIEIPNNMLKQNEQTIVHQEQQGDFGYYSAKRVRTDCELTTIREEMMRGYVEMSQINLGIAAECLHAEFEAQHTVERIVSGG